MLSFGQNAFRNVHSPVKPLTGHPNQDATLLLGLLDNSPNGLVVYQAVRNEQKEIIDFEIICYNQKGADFIGLENQLQIGALLFELYPVREQYIQLLRQVTEQRIPYIDEHFYTVTNRWIRFSLTPLGDGFLSTLEDITQIKQQDTIIRQQAELFNSVMANMQSGVLILKAIYDNDGLLDDMEYVQVNQTALRDGGLTQDILTGKRMRARYPNVEKTAMWARYQRVLRTGAPERFDMCYEENGLNVCLDVSLSRLSPDMLLSCYLNISQAKKHERQLEEQISRNTRQSRLLQNIIDQAMIPIALFESIRDDQGQIIDFRFMITNSANASYAGKTTEQLIGQRFLSVFSDAAESEIFQRMIMTVETDESQRFIYNYQGDNLNIWTDSLLHKHEDGVLFMCLDVTESQLSRIQLEQLNVRLMASNEHLEQFAYIASHDMQEPLRKIQSFGDLLKDQYSHTLDSNAIDLIRRMQIATARMQTMVRDLLTYSRVSSVQEAFEPVSLPAVLSDVLLDLDLPIQAKQATLRMEGNLPTIRGIKRQLMQLFQNLLSNALKFSQPGIPPLITVAYQTVPASVLPDIVCPEAKTYHLFTITDNGIGFEEKHSDRIFQMFQRLNGRSQYDGNGIGLAVCRKVAENHKGYLTASSVPGKGSTFYLYLPL